MKKYIKSGVDTDKYESAFKSIDGVLYSKDGKTLVACPRGKTSVTIPDSVKEISSSAFQYCTSLTSVTIPDSVKEIDPWAFYNCTSLESVTIPDSVTRIGREVFEGCTSLIIYTDNPIAIEYCEENGIPYKSTGLTTV